MAVSLEHLLPAADEAVRCAEHARAIGVDPGGSAIRADRVVVVTVTPPWPKPALDHPLLVDAASALRSSVQPTRLLAATTDTEPAGTVIVYDRVGPVASETVFAVDPRSPADLASLAARLAPARPGVVLDAATVGRDPVQTFARARPTALVCTQGSHDVCCGSAGTRLADRLDSTVDGVRVLRVSHTGGHRFAPTAMTMPTGRMWSGLTVDDVRTIFSGGPLDDLVDPVPRAGGGPTPAVPRWPSGRSSGRSDRRSTPSTAPWSSTRAPAPPS